MATSLKGMTKNGKAYSLYRTAGTAQVAFDLGDGRTYVRPRNRADYGLSGQSNVRVVNPAALDSRTTRRYATLGVGDPSHGRRY